MKLYNAGDKSTAICETCQAITDTTYGYKDVPFSDGNGLAKDILVANCDACGGVAAIPAQSLPAINRSRPKAEVPLEVKLPAPDIEVLDAAATLICQRPTVRHRKMIVSYYTNEIVNASDTETRLKSLCDAAKGDLSGRGVKVPRKRLSMKVSEDLNQSLASLMAICGGKKTDVIRGVVQRVRHDLVLNENARVIDELKRLVAVQDT